MFSSLFIAAPIIICRPFQTKNNKLFFTIFYPLVSKILGIKFVIHNQEVLQRNNAAVIISNHQHNFDLIPLALVFTENVAVLGKKQLGYLPLFGQLFTLAGNILVDRSNRKRALASMDKLENAITEKNTSIFIFPEGHRNKGSQELLPFKKGAFYTAVRAQAPIIPISIERYHNHIFTSSSKKREFNIYVHPPIETKGLSKTDIPRLMQEARESISKSI